jgi:uncharacterized membrane protein YfcA
MSLFLPVFAALVFFIAAQLLWQIVRTNATTMELTRTMRASESFELQVKSGGDLCDKGVRCVEASMRRFVFSFGDERFEFNPFLPFFTGLGIAVLSSALGVGGGFLLVPFMSIVMRLPMYVIAGTSAMAIAIHSITSISNYVRLGIELDLAMLAILLAGVVAGSTLGPLVSKHVPENGLRGLLATILVMIGLRYAGLF